MIELGKEQVGRKVVYTPFPGCDPTEKQEGIITSWNEGGIFVQYGNSTTSQRTDREDLEYIS